MKPVTISLDFYIGEHSIIMFALRGEGGPSKYENMRTEGGGEVSHQCERSHVNFFN